MCGSITLMPDPASDPSLSDRIAQAFASLPPQLQAAASFVLEHPDDVALLSMREQARRAGVPPVTMTRLAAKSLMRPLKVFQFR